MADRGGLWRGNGNRLWAWKVGLQRLANEFQVAITVSHYPPGASKWNRIEHRMFNLISQNWAGEPLVSYETVLNYIQHHDLVDRFPLSGGAGPSGVSHQTEGHR